MARHIVITGAGSGIGRAIALHFAAKGDRISLLGRRADPLEATAVDVERLGGTPMVTPCDIRHRSEVDRALQTLCAAQGALDILIANSGIGGPNEDGPEDRFEELVATNLTGTYHCARAALQHMEDSENLRHIIVVSSILGRIGVAGYTGYCASKTGLLGLVRALAHETVSRRIQVNAICPGWVNTEMAWQGIDGIAGAMNTDRDAAFQVAMSAVPTHRMSEPTEIARAIGWMASNDAIGMTGQAIDINQGAFMI
jgi:NAD(P)-dependent dehydrogenase (short-subunit alcohol dehydrogenase family)